MRTTIQKWGNSLAVRIPHALASEAGLTEHAPIDISSEDAGLRLVRLDEPNRGLDALLAGVTDENIHGEFDTGYPVGNEAW